MTSTSAVMLCAPQKSSISWVSAIPADKRSERLRRPNIKGEQRPRWLLRCPTSYVTIRGRALYWTPQPLWIAYRRISPKPRNMLDFCGAHNITADVEVIPIQKINQAYERMVKSDVKYRFSIDMASLKSEQPGMITEEETMQKRKPSKRNLEVRLIGSAASISLVYRPTWRTTGVSLALNKP